MMEQSRGTTRAALAAVALLFLLSVAVPRQWHRIVHLSDSHVASKSTETQVHRGRHAEPSQSGTTDDALHRSARHVGPSAADRDFVNDAVDVAALDAVDDDRSLELAGAMSGDLPEPSVAGPLSPEDAYGAELPHEPVPDDIVLLDLELDENQKDDLEGIDTETEDIADSDAGSSSELGIEPSTSPSEQKADRETVTEYGVASARIVEAPSDSSAVVPDLASVALVEQLDRVAWDDTSRRWTGRVRQLLDQWAHTAGEDFAEASELLDRLEDAATDVQALLKTVAHRPQASPLRRLEYQLRKRLEVWRAALPLLSDGRDVRHVEAVAKSRLVGSLEILRAHLAGSPELAGWERYLLFDRLMQSAAQPISLGEGHRRNVAQEVLERIANLRMEESFSEFVREPAVEQFEKELRCWVAEPLTPRQLLAKLEQYEQQRLPSQAVRLAPAMNHLRRSAVEEDRALGQRLEVHYRNCNVRLAVASDLLSRVLPDAEPTYEPVRETVLGVPVRGRSYTDTELSIRLLPDPRRARIALVARGNASARTSAFSKIATLRSSSRTYFEVHKPIEFDLKGMTTESARGNADSDSQLRGVDTKFDRLPLVGRLVRGEVERQYLKRLGAVGRQGERLVSERASHRMDEQTDEAIQGFNELLYQRLELPLVRLGLDDPLQDFRTTDERLTLRVRIAGNDQLGAHTPRPQAPSDSLLSVQVHESALNNCLERLRLAGRTFAVQELQQHVADTLVIEPERTTDRDDVWLTFAKDNPVMVLAKDGRLLVVLRMAWIQKDRRRWSNFEVRVAYRPDRSMPGGQFVRDGVVQLIGNRLGARGQIALRSIFSNLFREDRTFRIFPPRVMDDPRMAGLATTQFVVEDGWIAAAVAERRRQSSRTARR